MCYIRIFELCDRLLLNNKIERKRCKRCPASFFTKEKYVCQRECMFDIFLIYIGNYDMHVTMIIVVMGKSTQSYVRIFG